jgi:superfamily II DNA or RNA helicase
MAIQFSDFYASLDADSAKRGKQFEHFVKWFFQTDPEWATQVDQVWLWEEWPQRWGADCGIDLVFRHKNGEHWAVQAKCYSPDYAITKHDVDKFLSESNRPLIQHRLLIASTDGIGANAKQVCDAQDKPVIRYLLSDFERALVDYPANMAALPQAKRKARPAPREHQVEAITTVMQGLANTERGQLIMACGTGKTYVTLWLKEAMNAQRTLVLVPSLGLLSQLLREWTFAANTSFEVLCVCSDQTVGSKGNDEAIHSVADLAFPVTSDAEEVKRFLRGTGNRVVFSTYQSSSVIVAAQTDSDIADFDFAVADEAHRCAGKVGSDFTAILDGAQIRSRKRLFATATPRTYSSTVKKSAEERGVEVVGMDDVAQFGEVLYALPFGQAIARKLLTDYRVVIIGVDDPTIAQWIANRELIATDTGIETDSESLAAQIGLLKAIKDYDLKRVISFHSRVKRAERFTRDIHHVRDWINDEHCPSGTLHTDYVSGDMSAHKRKIKIDQLKTLSTNERGVLSNARCLSEGVDVPSLDGVAFIDPRSSQVDIIQAVGRAIRLSADKKIGTIILPVFIKSGEDAASTIEASNFKPVWDVLNALKAHDDVLACELDSFRNEMGRKSGSGFHAGGLNRISIDLPVTVDHEFGSALRTHLVDSVTDSWDGWLGRLLAYKDIFEHCNVATGDAEYPGLAGWVSSQRVQKNSGNLSLERINKLEAIGFVWNFQQQKTDETWLKWYRALQEYALENGNPHVPRTHANTKLASWVWIQRARRDKVYGSAPPLTSEQIELLDKLGFHWDARQGKWLAQLEQLKAFKAQFGHCNVELQNVSYSRLLIWLTTQRKYKKDGTLESEREAFLNELGMDWVGGSVVDVKWREKYEDLKQYHAEHGNSDVPNRKEGDRTLASWVMRQREQRKKDGLTDEQISLLDEVGFTWQHRDRESWDDRLAEVIAFKEKYGHCDIPMTITDPPKLGAFVNNSRSQRSNGTLSAERIAKLDAVGFLWAGKDYKIGENGMNEAWKLRFDELLEYKKAHGNCNVPTRSEVIPQLGNWVNQQRILQRSGKLHLERVRLLDEAGFSWGGKSNKVGVAGVSEAWKARFDEMLEYKKMHGDCAIPAIWKENPPLGKWVVLQRTVKKSGKMDAERERLLNEVEFLWDGKR